MMKFAYWLFVLMVPFASHAQVNNECFPFKASKCGEHELGINLFSIQDFRYSDFDDAFSANVHYPSGMMYKLHCGQNSFRVGLDYYYRRIRTEDRGEMHYYFNDGHSNTLELRLGYERRLGTSRLQPFIGGEAFVNFNRQHGVFGGYGDFKWWYTEEEYDRMTTTVGLSMVSGVKYYLDPRFSITAEMNLSFAYRHKEDRYGDILMTFSPVRLLSINYHF